MTLYQDAPAGLAYLEGDKTAVLKWVVPVEPDDVMNAAHKLVHPRYDNAADCDKFWCEPFRALKQGIGGDDDK